MTTKIRSPTGLEICTLLVINLFLLSTFINAAPLQESVDIQEYSEGCYYNYNHYNEGDRISTNEPCLNCTCHNKMLMCYLRVCPFTKPIGHDCVVEKREDQCCPIITCPEVPVELSHQSEPGTELAIPEKYGCTIDNKFYTEGAQVPSHPNKPCELCYCIKNRTSCLMQECTLHIDGCQPIYNKDSCCPVRYNCDHENELLEDSTMTTVRPTPGFMLTTVSSLISSECYHEGIAYADGALIRTANSCENCYCMHGDIVCAVQKCDIPTMQVEGKLCKAGELLEGECCPINYICEDDNEKVENKLSPVAMDKISHEDEELQKHIDKDTQYNEEDDTKEKEDSMDLEKTTVTNSEDIVTETTIPTNINEDNKINIPAEESQEIEIKTESNLILSTVDDEIQDTNQLQIGDIPMSIPGEGSCLVDGETYSNNTRVATSNECEEYCICVSSVVTCKPVECNPPPSKNCTLDIENKFECCPVYICKNYNQSSAAEGEKDEHIDDAVATTSTPELTSSSKDHDIEKSTIASETSEPSHSTISSIDENADGITSSFMDAYSTTTKKPAEQPEDGSNKDLSDVPVDVDSTTVAYENVKEGSGSEDESSVTTVKYPSTSEQSSTTAEDKSPIKPEEDHTDSPITMKSITSEEESDYPTTARVPVSHVSSTKDSQDSDEDNSPTEIPLQTLNSTDRSPGVEENTHSLPSKIPNTPSDIVKDSESTTTVIPSHESTDTKDSITINPLSSNQDEAGSGDHAGEFENEFTTENPIVRISTKLPYPKTDASSPVQHTLHDITTSSPDLSEDKFSEEKHLEPQEQKQDSVTENLESLTTPNFVEENAIEKNNSFPDSGNLFVDDTEVSTIYSVSKDNNTLQPEINVDDDDAPRTTLYPLSEKFDKNTTPKITPAKEEILEKDHDTKPLTEEDEKTEQTTAAPHEKPDGGKESVDSENRIGETENELISTTQESNYEQMLHSTESNENINSMLIEPANKLSDNQLDNIDVTTEHFVSDLINDNESKSPLASEPESEAIKPAIILGGDSDESTTLNIEKQDNDISVTTTSRPIILDNELDSEKIATETTTTKSVKSSTENIDQLDNDLEVTTLKNDNINYALHNITDAPQKLDTIGDAHSTTSKSIDSEIETATKSQSDEVFTTEKHIDQKKPIEIESISEYKLDENILEITTTLKSTDLEKTSEKETSTESDSNIEEALTTVKSVDVHASPEDESTQLKLDSTDDSFTTVKSIDSGSSHQKEIDQPNTTVKSMDSEILPQKENDTESEADSKTEEPHTTVSSADSEISPQKEEAIESETDIAIEEPHTTVKSTDFEASPQKKDEADSNIEEAHTTVKSSDSEDSPQKESDKETKVDLNIEDTHTTAKSIDSEVSTQKESDAELEADSTIEDYLTTVKSIDSEVSTQKEGDAELEADSSIEEYLTTVKSIDSEVSTQKEGDAELEEEEINTKEHHTTVKTVDSAPSSQKESGTETGPDSNNDAQVHTTESPQKEIDLESSTDVMKEAIPTTVKSIKSEESPQKENKPESNLDEVYTTAKSSDSEAITPKESEQPGFTTASSTDLDSQNEIDSESKANSNSENIYTTVKNIDSKVSDLPSGVTQPSTVTESPEKNVSVPDSNTISDDNVVTEQIMDLIKDQSEINTTIKPFIDVTTQNIQENQSTTIRAQKEPENVMLETGNTQNSQLDSVTPSEDSEKFATTEQIETSKPMDQDVKQHKDDSIATEKIDTAASVNSDVEDESSSTNKYRIEATESNEMYTTSTPDRFTQKEQNKPGLSMEESQSSITTERNDDFNDTSSEHSKPELVNRNGEAETNEMHTTSSPAHPLEKEDNKLDESSSEASTEQSEYVITTERNDDSQGTTNKQAKPDSVNNIDSASSEDSETKTEVPTSLINTAITESPNKIHEDKTTQNTNIDNETPPQNGEHDEGISKEDSTTSSYQSPIEQSHNMIEVETTSPSINKNNESDKSDEIVPMTISAQEKPIKIDSERINSTKEDAGLATASPSLVSKVTEASPSEKVPYSTTAIPQSTFSTIPQTGMYAPPQYSSYPEDEYTDEDESEIFGPGTCRYGGKLYVSAQQIPRDDPCDFCFCFRSDIICLQQSCPPPISGCREEPIHGFCCPRYECPVSMGTVMNITTSTTTTSTTLPPHFLSHNYQGSATKSGCFINGVTYKIGDEITSSSGPCMQCLCGGDGQMKCSPKACSPEPLMRQMVAQAISNKR